MVETRLNIALVMILAGGVACGDDGRKAEIDQYIRASDFLGTEPASRTVGETSDKVADGDFSCSSYPVGETKTLDRVVAYAANSDALWPGAIVGGRSVADGLLAQRVFDRAPLTFSVSLESLEGNKSAKLKDPRLSTYREAMSQILGAELKGATPANLYAEIEDVYSKEQLELALGAKVEWFGGFGASVAGSFDFNTSAVRSRALVRYIQSYYTVDVDPPERPSDMFGNSVTVDDVRAQLPPGDPAVYVSSITYGRLILFAVESSESSSELRAALEFAYGQAPRIEGSVSLSSEEVLDRSKITAYILGGSGEMAAQNIDSYEGLRDLIRGGGNYSPDSPGAPIAYRLSYLADNSPARLSMTQDYTVRDCSRVSQRVRVTLDGIHVDSTGDDGPEIELYGGIWSYGTNEEQGWLFNRGSGESVTIAEGETWPQGGPLAEAIVDVDPEPGKTIHSVAKLVDYDSGLFDGDDGLGQVVVDAPYESGWRRQVTMYLTNSHGARVEVLLGLQPI